MERYAVADRNIQGADAGEPVHALWNPHASISLYVMRVLFAKQGATANDIRLARITTRGTANTTVTPDIDNHFRRRHAPLSGALMDRGNYSVAPTVEGPDLMKHASGAAIGSSIELDIADPGIEVPAGTGLAIVANVVVALITDGVFIWEE